MERQIWEFNFPIQTKTNKIDVITKTTIHFVNCKWSILSVNFTYRVHERRFFISKYKNNDVISPYLLIYLLSLLLHVQAFSTTHKKRMSGSAKIFSSAEVFLIQNKFGNTDICLENVNWQLCHGHSVSYVQKMTRLNVLPKHNVFGPVPVFRQMSP